MGRLSLLVRGVIGTFVVVALGTMSAGTAFATRTSPSLTDASLTCSDTWTHTAGGSWSTAADWSKAKVPSSTDVACITKAGTYTVTLDTSVDVKGLVVGKTASATSGTQTLLLTADANDGSALDSTTSHIASAGALDLEADDAEGHVTLTGTSLTNDGTLQTLAGTGGTEYVELGVTNKSDGTMVFGGNTQYNGTYTFTNDGALEVPSGGELELSGSSTLTQSAGTLTNDGTFFVNGATLTQSGGTVNDGSTTMDGATFNDAVGTGSILLECSNTLAGTIPAGQSDTVQGNTCNSADTTLSDNVTNDGTLSLQSYGVDVYSDLTDSGGGTLTNNGTLQVLSGEAGADNYLEVNVDNSSGSTAAIGANTLYDADDTFVNEGALTISSGALLTVSDESTISQSAGTLTNDGSLLFEDATLTQSGGTVKDGNTTMEESTFNDAVGTGSFLFECSNTLAGTIPKGQTIAVQANACGSANTTLSANVTNDGTVSLQNFGESQYSDLTDSSGGTLTNDGTLEVLSGAPGAQNYLEVSVDNTPGSKVILGASTLMDDDTTLLNHGTITIASGADLAVTGGSTITQAEGTFTDDGSMSFDGGVLTQSGGTVNDGTVTMESSTFTDSVGHGSFLLECSNTISGKIPPGQTLLTESNSCGAATTTVDGNLTNKGTIALESLDEDSPAYLDDSSTSGMLTNDGTIEALAGAPGASFVQINTTNKKGGTVSVADGANLSFTGYELTETPSSTLGVTVDANTDAGYGIVGGKLALAGTLLVTTVGTPTTGSDYEVISGSTDTGTFSTVTTGSQAYTVAYNTTGVTLTAS